MGAAGRGVAFRVPTGMALMMNTHVINASAQAIDNQAVLGDSSLPASQSGTLIRIQSGGSSTP